MPPAPFGHAVAPTAALTLMKMHHAPRVAHFAPTRSRAKFSVVPVPLPPAARAVTVVRPAVVALLLAVASAPAACGPPETDGWHVVHAELPGALISIWGTAADNVWAVGGDAQDGKGPTVLHHDGSGWTRRLTGHEGDLWWVTGFANFPGAPVLAGGAGGQILRYDAATDAFTRDVTPGSNTVFGLWGPAPDDVWAVGGSGSSGAFAWRHDGTAWRVAEGLPAGLEVDTSLFKVWGNAADDVWLVGSGGLALHYDGTAFTRVDVGTTRTLFTVHTAADLTVAVGGFGTGVIVEHDSEHENGTGWRDVTPIGARQTIGVHVGPVDAWAVGIDAQVLRRTAGGWIAEQTDLPIFSALHAVWADSDGGVWAVGGEVLMEPLVDGVLIYRGPNAPLANLEER